jgi:hypothetical protein
MPRRKKLGTGGNLSRASEAQPREMARSGESQPALGSFPATGLASFHKAKDSAPAHSIESKDNLVSVEDGDEPVQVRVASCGPGAMYSPRMRLASSIARNTVS